MAEIEVMMTFNSLEEMIRTLGNKRIEPGEKSFGEELQEEFDNQQKLDPVLTSPSDPPMDPKPPTSEPSATTTGLDVEGVPWDERIHASTKGRTKKGKWKRRKGIEDSTYLKITNELKSAQTKSTNVTPLPTSTPPADPPSDPKPTPPVEQPQAKEIGYFDLIQKFGSMNYGINDMNVFLKKNCGLETIAALSTACDTDPDLPSTVSALLDAAGPLPPKE